MSEWFTLPIVISSLSLARAGDTWAAYCHLPPCLPAHTSPWPDQAHTEFQYLRATLATQAGQWLDALHEWERLTALAPSVLAHWHALAEVAAAAGAWPQAVTAVTQLYQQAPTETGTQTLYHDVVLAAARAIMPTQREIARAWLHTAVQHYPHDADFSLMLADCYRESGALAQAQHVLQQQLRQTPEHLATQWNLGWLARRLGDYQFGWQAYELRWSIDPNLQQQWRHYPFPLWQGECLSGKTLLLWCEQGLGDTLQFCRFLPDVATQAQHLMVECPPPLFRLLQANFPSIECAMNASNRIADYHLPLTSLPERLAYYQTSTLHRPAYLQPVSQPRLTTLLQPATRPRIGLVWQAGQQKCTSHGQQNADARSLPVEIVSTFGEKFPQWEWWNLQFDHPTAWPWLQDASSAIADVADAAAILWQMDALVTVDTMMAHLAGALGKPAVVLLHHDACWRWGNEAQHSIWYDSLLLLRQTQAGDWHHALCALTASIAQQLVDSSA